MKDKLKEKLKALKAENEKLHTYGDIYKEDYHDMKDERDELLKKIEKRGGEMKVFRIFGLGLYAQVHCVVAESFAKAYEIWEKSGGQEPEKIELFSNHVLVQEEKNEEEEER